MSKTIATIRLCPGIAGFYDELTRIHLTIGQPIAQVYAGMNCSQLRRSVKAGTIEIVEGSFGEAPSPYHLVKKQDGSYALSLQSKLKKATETLVATAAKAKAKIEAEAEKTVTEAKVVAKTESKKEEKVEAKIEAEVAEEAVAEAEAPAKEEKPAKKTTKKSTKKAAKKEEAATED